MKEIVKDEINKAIQENVGKNREKSIVINNNKSMFNKKDFEKIKEGKPKYSRLDKYGRSRGATALISKYTKALIIEKKIKYDNPSNWTKIYHHKINKIATFERCHIIGYSLSARLCKKENMFIGTNHLNTGAMETFEKDLMDFIDEHKESKILYRVTLIYYDKELIPRGVLMEAKEKRKYPRLDKCIFCFNIDKYVKFDYTNGKLKNIKELKQNREITDIIENQSVKEERESYEKQKDDEDNKYQNYIIDIRKKVYHKYNNKNKCSKLKRKSKKYLNETRTKENILLENKYKICDAEKLLNKN